MAAGLLLTFFICLYNQYTVLEIQFRFVNYTFVAKRYAKILSKTSRVGSGAQDESSRLQVLKSTKHFESKFYLSTTK